MREHPTQTRLAAGSGPGGKVRVLLVEDDADHRLLITRQLAPLGFEVSEAASGEQALERACGVDLVICDYGLPGMSGLDVLERLAAQDGPSVVMVTGRGSEDVAVAAMRAGAVDYLIKDSRYLEALPRVVERAWYHHDLRRRSQEVQRLALLIGSTGDRATLLEEIRAGARMLLRAESCRLFLHTDGTLAPIPDTHAQAGPADPLHALAGTSVETGRVAQAEGMLAVPLPGEQGPVGALVLVDVGRPDLPPEEVRLAQTLASFAGIAVENRNRLDERTRALEQLMVSEQRFRKAFENAPIGMALLSLERDRLGTVLEPNQELCRILDRRADRLVGEGLWNALQSEDAAQFRRQVTGIATGEGGTAQVERRLRRADGSVAWVRGSVSSVTSGQGRPLYAILQLEDVTGRRQAEQRLRSLALHDRLTGLANRTLLRDRLAHALRRHLRTDRHLAVLCVDLDRFKFVNDGWGHDAGDQLLTQVAARISRLLSPTDTAARIGGDEFVVAAEELDDGAQAPALADRIADALAQPFDLPGGQARLTATIGGCLAGPSHTPDTLLRDADTALYEAKRRKRDRCLWFDEALGTRAAERTKVEQELRSSLDGQAFSLVYQPLFDAATQRLEGAEALVRWRHPERGLLRPSEFLEVAEETSLVVPLGRWVLTQACRQAAAWQSLQPGTTVWVNVSGRHAAGGSLPRDVFDALEASGLDPELLWLELTESALFAAGEAELGDLAALRERGVRFVIDDFGTGYASMSYLTQFPSDGLKIDRSFVQQAVASAQHGAIVQSVAQLGRRLGLTVVAEGVETAEQLAFAVAAGSALVQGHHLARPASVDELRDALVTGRAPTAPVRTLTAPAVNLPEPAGISSRGRGGPRRR